MDTTFVVVVRPGDCGHRVCVCVCVTLFPVELSVNCCPTPFKREYNSTKAWSSTSISKWRAFIHHAQQQQQQQQNFNLQKLCYSTKCLCLCCFGIFVWLSYSQHSVLISEYCPERSEYWKMDHIIMVFNHHNVSYHLSECHIQLGPKSTGVLCPRLALPIRSRAFGTNPIQWHRIFSLSLSLIPTAATTFDKLFLHFCWNILIKIK